MNWMDGFKEALLTYIRKNGHTDAEKILYWDEQITRGDLGGCDTCGWGSDEPYELRIQFARADGTRGLFTSTTPFGELISSLVED